MQGNFHLSVLKNYKLLPVLGEVYFCYRSLQPLPAIW